MTSSLQKLVSKPGTKGQSKVLQSEALNSAWPSVSGSATSKPKQKVIMLQNNKKKIM